MKVLYFEPLKSGVVKEIDGALKTMQDMVGGYIQAVYLPDGVALVCNEEGKFAGLPPNRALYDGAGNILDVIMGNFFLCYAPPEVDSFQSLPDDLIEKYCKIFNSYKAMLIL